MAVEVNELIQSRQISTGTSNRARMLWMVDGTDDEIVARNSLLAVIPAAYDPYGLGTTSWPLNALDVETQDADHWTFTVVYEGGRDGTTNQFSFDTTGGSTEIQYSRQTVSQGPGDGRPLVDFKGGINVTDQGPQGVSIVTPQYEWTQTFILSNATVTDAYKTLVRDLTGSVNSTTYKGLAAGECLFMGMSGSKTGALGNWTMTAKFASSPNQTNVAAGGFIIPFLRGWDYIWFSIEPVPDLTAKKLVMRPYQYSIERVYPYADLSPLLVP